MLAQIKHDPYSFCNLQEAYGGHGYKHLIAHIAPQMVVKGMTQEQVDKIFVANPAGILAYWKYQLIDYLLLLVISIFTV